MHVVVEGLTRRFGKTTAVDDLSFRFGAGEIFAFVGPNGAGKTTTMRIMATLDQPDDGTVLLDGVPVPEYPEEARLKLGYMPDSLPAHRDVVVHEYLDFFARSFGIRNPRRRAILDELERFVGLGAMRDKPLRALSKGMKQRVSLARALVHDPPLLILDEPAAGLDPRARVELRELLRALAARGKAILISSHILNELEEMSHGAVIIEKGRLIHAGSLAELEARPATNGQRTPRRVAIKALGDLDAIRRHALQTPMVLSAELTGPVLALEIDGGDEQLAELLHSLVSAGHRVVEFHAARASLERLFMEVTRGDVQ